MLLRELPGGEPGTAITPGRRLETPGDSGDSEIGQLRFLAVGRDIPRLHVMV